jgi:hypothetical protein
MVRAVRIAAVMITIWSAVLSFSAWQHPGLPDFFDSSILNH